jgi:hypothetical protein
MDIDPENPLVLAAIIFLHREAAKIPEIRLTRQDFERHSALIEEGIQFSFDPETGDVILRHVKPVGDA